MKPAVERNAVLHALRIQKTTLKKWCDAEGHSYRNASNVLRGLSRANYGEGKVIADKLNALVRGEK